MKDEKKKLGDDGTVGDEWSPGVSGMSPLVFYEWNFVCLIFLKSE